MVTTRPDDALVLRARFAAAVAVALLLWAAPASADHLTLDPAARPLAARPFANNRPL